VRHRTDQVGAIGVSGALGARNLQAFATRNSPEPPRATPIATPGDGCCGDRVAGSSSPADALTMGHMAEIGVRSIVRQLRGLLPEESRPAAVEYGPSLVTFVAGLAAASLVLIGLNFRAIADPLTLGIGTLVVFGTAYCAVRITGGGDSVWTASVFIHLALAFTFGPFGALAASLAQAGANLLRMRSGWFRAIFNASNYFLTDFTAWAVFARLVPLNHSFVWQASAATVAALVECSVNHGLVSIVISLSSGGKVSGWHVFRHSMASVVLYNIGYGWAAFGAVLLYGLAGTVGFTTTLLPVILLQGFLVLLARRVKAQEKEREEHAKEREALLQQAIEASDAERKRIASDLHDGVVQTLAGLAFSLAARGSGKTEDPQLLEAAETLRSSVTDLRTLMIEIAPPDLGETGMDGALRKLLEPLPARGIEVELEAATTHLPPDKTSLVFRVAQEAIRNVVNHSQATKVITRLRFADGTVTLQVDDNGRGFSAADRSRRREEGHVGLHLLNNAVEASSGRLSLTSEPGHGTSLMLTLPC
jgi:signal transduction histidine kinase